MMMLLLSRLRVYLPPMKRSMLLLLVGNPFLISKSNTSARRGPSLKKVNNPCWSFAKSSCRFGDACKYLHNGVHGKSTLLPRTSGSASSVPDVTRSDLDMLVSAQLFAQPTYVSPQLLPGSFGGSNMGMVGLFPQGPVSDAVTTARSLLSTSRGSDAFWSTAGVFPFPSTKSTTTPSYDFLDDSNDLISIIIRTAPITPVPAPVHTLQIDVPTPPTPPTPPPPPTPQSVPQIVPKHAPVPTNDSPTVSIHPMVTRSRVETTRPNPRYAGHMSIISPLPRSYKEAFNDPNWRNAMFDDQYKARLVANGSTQVEGVDVDKTCSPVVKPGTIQTVLGLAISRHWPVHQLDIIASLHREFSMIDFGALNYFLGISVMRDSSGMFLSQRKYAMEILERAHVVGCNPSRTPIDIESKLGDGGTLVVDPTLYRSLASSLLYLTFIRPHITYVVQQGTLDYGLQLFSSTTDSLIAYSDADWDGCPTTRRSTSRDLIATGQVHVLHVPSWFQYVDIFTKGLPSALFDEFRDSLSVRCTPAPTAGEY
nr:ribonuclease H-like domain-containing protein [Tanacetum cinerariifolium]